MTRQALSRFRAVAGLASLVLAWATVTVPAAAEAPAAAAAAVPRYVRTLAPPGLADLTPVDVAATATHYYVIDVARYRIVKIARSSGAVVAQVGGSRGLGSDELAAARSIAADSRGNVYIADTPNNRVGKYDANLRPVRTWGGKGTGPGQFTQVYGVAVGMGLGPGGGLQEILYAIDGNGRIQRFTLDGQLVGAFAPDVALQRPRMAEVHPTTHDLWVVNTETREIVVLSPQGQLRFRFGRAGTGPGQFKGDTRGIAISDDGTRVYTSDEGNHRVQVFDAKGTYVSSMGGASPDSPAWLVDARGLEVLADGTLVVTDQWDHGIKEFATGGAFRRELFGSRAPVGGVNSPRGLAVDPSGRVYVSDWWNQRVQRFGPGDDVIGWGYRGTTDEPGSIDFAWGIAVQPGTGRVFLANRESHEVEVFSADGAFLTRWGRIGGGGGSELRFPQGVAFDPRDGTLVVTDSGNARVQRYRIDASGVGALVASYGSPGSAAGSFDTPAGIAVSADGTVWVADTRNSRVQKRHPGTGQWTAYQVLTGTTSRFSFPWGVSVGPDGDIWVADSAARRIVKADTAMRPRFVADGAALGSGSLNYPYDIKFGPGGEVYVSDTFNNRVIVLQQ